jgi:hypothetical protein
VLSFWSIQVSSLTNAAALTYGEGYRARSWIEYSLLKKYHDQLRGNIERHIDAIFPQILSFPLSQRRLHLSNGEHILAASPGPCEFPSQDT